MTGVQVKDVAQALDIHPFMLSSWRKEYREGKIVADKRKKKIRFYTDKYKTHFKVRLDEDGSVTESFAVARSTDADINQQKERNNLQAMPFNRNYAGENVLRGE